MSKLCSNCLRTKDLSDFSRHKKSKEGYLAQCKYCTSERKKELYHKNVEARRAHQRNYLQEPTRKKLNQKRSNDWYKSNREKYYEGTLKRKFGISLIEYNDMLSKQNNSCAICLKDRSLFKRRFNVDHCHKTGQVRGLLCSPCNTSIGLLNESLETIKRAADYLKEYL